MNRVMVYLPSKKVDESINFYKGLGFSIYADDLDGNKNRCVRMMHPTFPQILFNLNDISHLTVKSRPPFQHDSPFSLVVDDCGEWIDALESIRVKAEKEIIEPWGIWIYFRDPGNNLLCLTNRDIW